MKMFYEPVVTLPLNRGDAVFTAQLMDSFARILAQEAQAARILAEAPCVLPTPPEGLPERICTGYDHTLASFLFLSVQVTTRLNELVDWNAWDGGVFSYEHLDALSSGQPYHCCKSLPAYLYRKITDVDWYEIAGNHRLPKPEDLDVLIRDWARSLGDKAPPLRPINETGLSKEELRDRYPSGHPAHPRSEWKQWVANDTTLLSYWDWVKEAIAATWANYEERNR